MLVKNNNIYLKNHLLILLAVISTISFSAFSNLSSDGIWTFMGTDESSDLPIAVGPNDLPEHYALFVFDEALFRQLIEASLHSPGGAENYQISIPRPDGSFADFVFFDSEVLPPDLAELYPEIKTFYGWQVDDASVDIRFDISPRGFYAQIRSNTGTYYVSPVTNDNIYISFFASDSLRDHSFECGVEDHEIESKYPDTPHRPLINYGTTLRTYRIAVAATGEYTVASGGTKALALASIVTAINFINSVYQLEVGVRLQLISNNANIIYTNPATDPYNPALGNTSLLAQNQTAIDSVIGNANYDIGHLVHAKTGTGNSGSGVARLSSTCRGTSKAYGLSSATRIGLVPVNPFFFRILTHEIGHQFGANHSFNSSCNNNRNAATAFEPGGGSTIMSYAGGCSPYNVQTLADQYFHRISLEEISAFLSGIGSICDVLTNTGNAIPTAEAGPDYTIPRSTPFVLTGVGTDANANALSYAWEQFNNEIAVAPPQSTSVFGPLFRSFTPTSSPTRYFPRLADLLSNISPVWEVLPSVARSMNFSLVVRDNVGGAASDNMSINVHGASGPFVITSPNGGETRIGPTVVTWNPANTQLAPVNTALVDILLSINNGSTFSVVLANNTPNDGSQSVVLPNITTNLARIQVRAEGNIFFDISNAPFNIRPLISEQDNNDEKSLIVE